MRIASLLAYLCLSAFAHAETALRVMGFGGASNWPLFVAQERGFFRDAGLAVAFERAPDSATQMRRLLAEEIDIAMTAMDNVVGQERGDAIAFLGVNDGARLNLFAARDVAAAADLRGRDIGVDSIDTGYTLVLRQMLADASVRPGDYRLVALGGSRDRWNALREGRVAAAILNSPYDATAEGEGFRIVARSDAIGPYQASVGAMRRAWGGSHRETVVAFVRAYVRAVRWLRDDANRDEAIAILVRSQRGLGAPEAQRAYDEVARSFAVDGAIDPAGVRRVLELRRRFGPQRPLLGAEAYFDPAYRREALSSPAPAR